MEFLKIENALKRLVSSKEQKERFHSTAGSFEMVLKDNQLTPEEKALKIAEIIEKCIEE